MLAQHDWILSTPQTYSWQYLTGVFLTHHLPPPEPRLTIDSNELALRIVAETDMLGIMTREMLDVSGSDDVVLLQTPVERQRKVAVLTRDADDDDVLLQTMAQTIIAKFETPNRAP